MDYKLSCAIFFSNNIANHFSYPFHLSDFLVGLFKCCIQQIENCY